MQACSGSIPRAPAGWPRRCAALLLACCATAAAQDGAPSRGELLYSNHCVECHSTQMHWRDKRLAQDWGTLTAQVRRWQSVANLGWTEEDIQAVARHLNETIYRFPQSQASAASTLPAARAR